MCTSIREANKNKYKQHFVAGSKFALKLQHQLLLRLFQSDKFIISLGEWKTRSWPRLVCQQL